MNSNPLTITIGIPAHNEAKNILRILDSVLMQCSSNHKIERIIIACDGCTDDTARIVRGIMPAHPEVELIDDGLRLGKAGRLSNFYKLSESDLFVTFDADTVLKSDTVVEEMVSGFQSPKVGLVAGRGVPLPPVGFWERVFVTWVNIWYEIRKDVNHGDNVHNIEGCVSAMTKQMYKQVTMPKDIIADDEYLYFRARELKFDFVFVSTAIVYYRCPTVLKDYIAQSSRFISTKFLLEKYFHFDPLPYYMVPMKQKLRGLSTVFFRDPLFVLLACATQVYIRIVQNSSQGINQSGVWEQIKSSK